MNKITELMDSLDLSKLVPELGGLMGKAGAAAKWAVMIGPLLLTVLGLIYFFKAPKEANHSFGFRTYFGMGSVEAWRYTQRIAGLVMGALGILLTVIMGIVCLTWGGKDTLQLLDKAVVCLIWEVVLTVIAYGGIVLHISLRYDKDGNLRK